MAIKEEHVNEVEERRLQYERNIHDSIEETEKKYENKIKNFKQILTRYQQEIGKLRPA